MTIIERIKRILTRSHQAQLDKEDIAKLQKEEIKKLRAKFITFFTEVTGKMRDVLDNMLIYTDGFTICVDRWNQIYLYVEFAYYKPSNIWVVTLINKYGCDFNRNWYLCSTNKIRENETTPVMIPYIKRFFKKTTTERMESLVVDMLDYYVKGLEKKNADARKDLE